jgi:hypothetical protein
MDITKKTTAMAVTTRRSTKSTESNIEKLELYFKKNESKVRSNTK